MKVLGVLQARMSSNRLPGKVLLPVLGEAMLFRQIERLKHCQMLEHLVVATSTDASDDALIENCNAWCVESFRGSLDDVLDRFVGAAKKYEPEIVVRLTGDCPLTDPKVVDEVIKYFIANNYDYVSNCNPPTYPDGLDVEVMKYSSLLEAWKDSTLQSDREHVTPFLRNNYERFTIGNYESSVDYSMHRWTVDELGDYEFAKKIFLALYSKKTDFDMNDILVYLSENPELSKINMHIERNAGYRK